MYILRDEGLGKSIVRISNIMISINVLGCRWQIALILINKARVRVERPITKHRLVIKHPLSGTMGLC
jgi:hypothetical protein